jgi:hypothetical protein
MGTLVRATFGTPDWTRQIRVVTQNFAPLCLTEQCKLEMNYSDRPKEHPADMTKNEIERTAC